MNHIVHFTVARWSGRLAAIVIVLISTTSIHAREARQGKHGGRVEKVRTLYGQLYYDEAKKICQAVLDAGRNRRQDLIQLLLHKALIAAVQGRRTEAVKSFKKLMVINPLVKVGKGHPPRVWSSFRVARRWFERQRPLMIAAEAPRAAARDRSVAITMTILSDALSLVSRGMLYTRAGGSAAGFRGTMAQRRGDVITWDLTPSKIERSPAATSIEYFVAALDADFNQVALSGSPAEPHVVALLGSPRVAPRVARAPRRPARTVGAAPWYRRWWVWTVVGAVVVGSAVAIGVTAGRPEETVDAPITLKAPP